MEWWYGLIIFFGVTLLAGLVGMGVKAIRLRMGIRYGDEPNMYQCATCDGRFSIPVEWSDVDAETEYEENFSHLDVAEENRIVVCDDCFKDIMKFDWGVKGQ